MKKLERKLTLSKETVDELTDAELRKAGGGFTEPTCIKTCSVCVTEWTTCTC